jgi:hypothetical protein
MFIAALYVQRRAKVGMLDAKHVKRASRIFWLGTALSVVLVLALATFLYGYLSTAFGAQYNKVIIFIISFIFWLVVATGAAKAVERFIRLHSRIAVLLGYIFGSLCVISAPLLLFPYG